MSSKLEIFNGTMVLLGRDPTFSDPARLASQNAAGQALSALWPLVLPAALAAYPWNFACKRQVIAALEDAPTFQWATAYEKPADLLRVRDLNFVAGEKPEPFAVEEASILANCTGPANLRYIANILDPARFDAEFVDYLQHILGARSAFKITGSSTRGAELAETAKEMLGTSRTDDAQEAEEELDDQNGDWIDSRYV